MATIGLSPIAFAQDMVKPAPLRQSVQQPGAVVNAIDLAGTLWRGERLWSEAPGAPSDTWTVLFRPDGVLSYTHADGRNFTNGTWKQNNQVVMFEANQYFSVSIATITDNVMYGEMRNQRGESGAFKFERISGDVQTP